MLSQCQTRLTDEVHLLPKLGMRSRFLTPPGMFFGYCKMRTMGQTFLMSAFFVR